MRPRRAVGLVTAAAVLSSLAMLLPVLVAPVGADDRYWYLDAPAATDGSFWRAVTSTWDEVPVAVQSGRLAPLASLARRWASLVVTQLSLSTGLPLVAFVAALKLLLVVAMVLSVVVLVRTLRGRAADGSLARASGATTWGVAVVGVVLLAAGAQAQGVARNGWTAYPVLTYGCFVVSVLVAAAAVGATRLVHRRPRTAVPVALGMLLLAAVVGLGYEIGYAAVPAALLLVLLQPVAVGSPGDRPWRRAWRARAVVGGAFGGGFLALVLGVRVYVSRLCADGSCYSGVEPSLGPAAVRTTLDSVLSAVPARLDVLLRQDLAVAGLDDRLPGGPTGWSTLVAGLAVVAVLGAWWLAAERGATPTSSAAAAGGGRARAEGRLLLDAVAALVVVALGPAVVLGIAARTQEIVDQVGVPYRNTVMTWAGATAAAACVLLAVARLGSRTLSTVAAVGLATAAGLTAGVNLPRNLVAVEAARATPGFVAAELVQQEAVRFDPSPAGDARRCAALQLLVDGRTTSREPIAAAADRLYQARFGLPFCSTGDPTLRARRAAEERA